jgi:putative PIN family toxin of toxin-antitoxin system
VKVIIDTNVVLSAALRDRLPERVVRFVAEQDEWRWLITDEILAEYVEVLRRPKFEFSSELISEWEALLALRTVVVPTAQLFPLLRDPKDAPFLAAAISSTADFLITGDRDLLDAELGLSTCVLSVAKFAKQFQID